MFCTPDPTSGHPVKEIVTSTIANPTLTRIRLSAICLLVYAGFLRFDELQKLRCCDMVFMRDRMEIAITSSKTDQYRQGDRIPVARFSLSTCPVAMMEKFFKAAAIQLSTCSGLLSVLKKESHSEHWGPLVTLD